MHVSFANGDNITNDQMNINELCNNVYDLKEHIQKIYGIHATCIQLFRKPNGNEGTTLQPLPLHTKIQCTDMLEIFIVDENSEEANIMNHEEIKYLHEQIKQEQSKLNDRVKMIQKQQEKLNIRKNTLQKRCHHPNLIRTVHFYEREYKCMDCGWENIVGT